MTSERDMRDQQFENSALQQQLLRLVFDCPSVRRRYPALHMCDWNYALVATDGGIVCALSLREGDGMWGGTLIEITDEGMLKKLRSVKGQYFYGGFPVFYYDLLRGQTRDYKDHYRGPMASVMRWIESCEFSLVRGDKTYRGKVVRDPDNEHWCVTTLVNDPVQQTFYRGTMAEVLQWIEGCEVSIVEDSNNIGQVVHDPDNEHWCILLE